MKETDESINAVVKNTQYTYHTAHRIIKMPTKHIFIDTYLKQLENKGNHKYPIFKINNLWAKILKSKFIKQFYLNPC